MKRVVLAISFAISSAILLAQSITLPPSGDNQKSSVTQWIGLASVTITYNSPDVTGPNGEDRKGHIWGELVPFGFTDPDYGSSHSAPWRAGANENTTITFSHDMKVNGQDIKAGTYGVFLDVEKSGPWVWIFSKDAGNWGPYHYNPEHDVLRIKSEPKDVAYSEWLTFGFDERLKTSAVAFLTWETKRVDFKIELPQFYDLYVDQIRKDLQGQRMGFSRESWMDAAQFCADNKVNLDEALQWADYAISGRYIGSEDFSSLKVKAAVLTAMGKDSEAETIMSKALNLPGATMEAVHQYGRSLLAAGKNEKALDVFKLNQKRNPNDKFTTNVGLARAYSALGDKKNAIKYWEMAIKNLPENQKSYKAYYEGERDKLKS